MDDDEGLYHAKLRAVMVELLGAGVALGQSGRRDARTLSLMSCTRRAADLMGCASLVAQKLSIDGLAVIARAMYETMLQARWVLLSDENAKRFMAMGREQMKGIMVKNLKAGTARIVHKDTGEDVTDGFLRDSRLRDLDDPEKWRGMAKTVGMGEAHLALYGVMCMLAHGSYGDMMEMATDEWHSATIDSAAATGDHVVSLVRAWLQDRELPPAPNPFSA